jgi:mono/diheme cytochrome c family protein
MKSCLAGIAVSGFLLGAFFLSTALGQERSKVAQKQNTKTQSVYAEISKAPEKARARGNPLEKDSEAVAAGRVLFEQRCAECHGDNAEGGKKGPSLRAAEIQNAEPGAIFWILTNGVVRRGMPVWSKLPEPQRWQIVSYIKSLGPAAAKPETSTPATSEPSAARDSSSPRR